MSRQFIKLFLLLLFSSCAIPFSSKTGTIYKLQCLETGKVYIGRTTVGTERAVKQNVKLFKAYKRGTIKDYTSMYEVMTNDNYNVTVLEEVYKLANDTDFLMRLKKRQRFYLEQYDNAVNKKIPSRTDMEYHEEHRDHYSQYSKVYYKKHRDTLLQKVNKYQQRIKSSFHTCKICGVAYKLPSLH